MGWFFGNKSETPPPNPYDLTNFAPENARYQNESIIKSRKCEMDPKDENFIVCKNVETRVTYTNGEKKETKNETEERIPKTQFMQEGNDFGNPFSFMPRFYNSTMDNEDFSEGQEGYNFFEDMRQMDNAIKNIFSDFFSMGHRHNFTGFDGDSNRGGERFGPGENYQQRKWDNESSSSGSSNNYNDKAKSAQYGFRPHQQNKPKTQETKSDRDIYDVQRD